MSPGALPRALAIDEPRVEDVALAIAADAYPGLDVEACLRELDAIAAPLREQAMRLADVRALGEALNARLFEELGFRGNEASYYDPRNSYLNEVLARRVGIPITLAVLMIAVGRRVGLAVDGVGFPGHFLVRIGGAQGYYADPFHRGKALTSDDLLELAERFDARGPSGERIAPADALASYLRPVDPRTVAVRMLSNLQQIFERAGDHARALVVCDRLVDVLGSPHHRRDRGRHALALGAYRSARVDLSAYLRAAEGAPDAEEIQALLERATRDEPPLH
ncbi:MAG: tetratricopeptide repeat protein [Deltaproteobacteria bacterium]|nr:tetratricopeptide repeat protein [Deltaproteobacteria bacterium]